MTAMNDKVRRRLDMLIRVDGFGRTYANFFPATSRGGELLTAVRAAITAIDNHTTAQAASAQSAKQQTSSKADLRDRLIEEMEAINLTARAMAATVPGLEDKFRMPRKITDQGLLVAARVFAQDAIAFKAEFVRREMAETFIDDLNGLIQEYSDSIGTRNQRTGARVAATEATEVGIEQGMAAVRELNAVVRNKLRNDRAALAEWQSVSHVERQTQHAKASPNGPATPPAAPPDKPEGQD
jgi:hypothetical protein